MCVGQNDEILSGLVKGVITSCQTNKIVETKNGELVNEQILNDNAFWTKMHSVASNTFGHTVYELNEWERTGNDAPRNMCSERAEDIMRDVFDIGQSMRRAIDAKSWYDGKEQTGTCHHIQGSGQEITIQFIHG